MSGILGGAPKAQKPPPVVKTSDPAGSQMRTDEQRFADAEARRKAGLLGNGLGTDLIEGVGDQSNSDNATITGQPPAPTGNPNAPTQVATVMGNPFGFGYNPSAVRHGTAGTASAPGGTAANPFGFGVGTRKTTKTNSPGGISGF